MLNETFIKLRIHGVNNSIRSSNNCIIQMDTCKSRELQNDWHLALNSIQRPFILTGLRKNYHLVQLQTYAVKIC